MAASVIAVSHSHLFAIYASGAFVLPSPDGSETEVILLTETIESK